MLDPERVAAALEHRYEIERPLGRGGMATVYLARDVKHARPVAVKVMEPALAVEAERFLLEIQTAARLNHPHILPVFDSGESAGLLYYVMPPMEESLRDRMKRGPADPEEAATLLGQVGRALAHAHERGVIHRDIKPENILFGRSDHAYLADFGIARALSTGASPRMTATGLAVGSPYYMSPEQAAGIRELDGRSDLFSLGCVGFEMLAGRLPYEGETFHELLAARATQPPSLTTLRSDLPPALVAAVATALSIRPEDRFPSADAFADALRGRRPPPRPMAAVRNRLRRWVRGDARGWIAVAIAAGVVGLSATLLRTVAFAEETPVAIAVLPFDGAGATGASADLHRWLAGALGSVAGLRGLDGQAFVADRPEWRSEPIQRILPLGRRRDVRYLVTGSVLAGGGDERITLDLWDLRAGGAVLHRSVVAPDGALGALDRIALELVGAVLDREGLDPDGFNRLAASTTSLTALNELLAGQRLFRALRTDAAVAAFERAIRADSAFGPAYFRLSTAETWVPRWDYGAALRAVEAGLRHAGSMSPRDAELLRAQRHFVLRNVDSAAVQFQTLVHENPGFPDALLGLGEVLFHYGGLLGEDPTTALPVLMDYLAADSTFAPVEEHVVDLAVTAGEEAIARAFLERTEASYRPIARAAVALRFGGEEERGEVLRGLAAADAPTLVALATVFLQERTDPGLADTLAGYLMQPRRTAQDRTAGAQLRFAALAAQGRAAEGLRTLESFAAPAFDPWTVHAHLAELPVEAERAAAMFAWAGRELSAGRSPDFTPLSGGEAMLAESQDAFRALVHRATVAGDSAEVALLLAHVAAAGAGADPSDPEPSSMRSALRARLALLGGDTTQAIGLLQQSLRRAPWSASWYQPLTDVAPQRLQLARLLAAQGRDRSAAALLRSFGRTWAVGDALFQPAADRLLATLEAREGADR